MKAAFASAFALLTIVACVHAAGTNWALLVAGSNSYSNYRHQADICHAYQILHKNGIPDSNIIVMMYDDIANNTQNPFKGNIINQPDGPNVYEGVPKDYTGSSVTAKNFLAVLSGDEEAVRGQGNGRVLKSGPDDNVFVFYSDHGSTGLVAMPSGPYLYAKDLAATFQSMHKNKRYGKLVFYLESCESGSMFYNNLLPDNINIYATSAANPYQSSYACYWDNSRRAYLGDLYSVSWMENADEVNINKETLQQQFEIVKNLTNLSEVMQWGQLTYTSDPIGNFLGSGRKVAENVHRSMSQFRERRQLAAERAKDAVDSRDVVMATLTRTLALADSDEERAEIETHLAMEMESRHFADMLFHQLVATTLGDNAVEKVMAGRHADVEHDCLRSMVETFESRCGRFNDYSLKYVYVLNNLCAANVDANTLFKAVRELC